MFEILWQFCSRMVSNNEVFKHTPLGGHMLGTKLLAWCICKRWWVGSPYKWRIWDVGRGVPEGTSNSWAKLCIPCEAHVDDIGYCCTCGNSRWPQIGRWLDMRGEIPNFLLISLKATAVSLMRRLYFRLEGIDLIPQCSKNTDYMGLTSSTPGNSWSIWISLLSSLTPLSEVCKVYSPSR